MELWAARGEGSRLWMWRWLWSGQRAGQGAGGNNSIIGASGVAGGAALGRCGRGAGRRRAAHPSSHPAPPAQSAATRRRPPPASGPAPAAAAPAAQPAPPAQWVGVWEGGVAQGQRPVRGCAEGLGRGRGAGSGGPARPHRPRRPPRLDRRRVLRRPTVGGQAHALRLGAVGAGNGLGRGGRRQRQRRLPLLPASRGGAGQAGAVGGAASAKGHLLQPGLGASGRVRPPGPPVPIAAGLAAGVALMCLQYLHGIVAEAQLLLQNHLRVTQYLLRQWWQPAGQGVVLLQRHGRGKGAGGAEK